jgi:hypothetical protein
MAAIPSINAAQLGAFAAAITTLSADDTITIDAGKKQLLVLRNTTVGSLTCTVDGDGGTTVNLPGAPAISVSAGYDIVVGAGLSKAVVLSTINAYTQGVVHLKGAAGMDAQLFNI